MVTKSLLLLGCSFMLGAVAGFATSAIISSARADGLRTGAAGNSQTPYRSGRVRASENPNH